MSSPIEPRADDANDFLTRVMRWLAILALALGAIHVIDSAVQAAVYGWRLPWASLGSFSSEFLLASQMLYAVLGVLQFVGAIGLLKWKRWGRTVLLIWAMLTIIVAISSNFVWLYQYASERRALAATTQPRLPPLAFYAWYMTSNTLTQLVLPTLTLWILGHRQAVELWAHRAGGGFEVVPLARQTLAETDTI